MKFHLTQIFSNFTKFSKVCFSNNQTAPIPECYILTWKFRLCDFRDNKHPIQAKVKKFQVILSQLILIHDYKEIYRRSITRIATVLHCYSRNNERHVRNTLGIFCQKYLTDGASHERILGLDSSYRIVT